MNPKTKRALRVALLIVFIFRPGLGSLVTWFDFDGEGRHALIYSGVRFDLRGAFSDSYWQHFGPLRVPAKLICLIDIPASAFSDTVALPVTAVIQFRRSRQAQTGTMPNQVAARNSRGRLSFAASGFSFAPCTFVAGAHPAVRELFR